MFQIHPLPDENGPAFACEGEFTIYAVADARRELEALQDAHPKLVLDLQEVQEIDSAGVQLLLWLKRRAGNAGRDLVLERVSRAVADVLDLLQVAEAFGALEA
ncbi:MAG TPA: STAS domain-containing protein [Holophaga sp.]|nr:STAS domain-containing protein [Holophaga sp.]